MEAMPTAVDLEATFGRHQRGLWAHCYRLTGCAADADEIVQETFARALQHRVALDADGWRRWLLHVATNLGIDELRRRRRRSYVGSWLPSPVEISDTAADSEQPTPEEGYAQRQSLSYAFLLALEALSPRQRAVLLLRDVLDYSAGEVGVVLAMSEANVRITHLRARRAMRDYDRRRLGDWGNLQEQTRRALGELLRCLLSQDAAGLESLLAESVRTVTDGGAQFTALHAPLVGRAKVMTLHLRVARRRGPGSKVNMVMVNGLPALAIEYARAERREAPRALLRCELDGDGRIVELHTVLADRKLSAVAF